MISRLYRLVVPYLAWASIYTIARAMNGSLNLNDIPLMLANGSVIVVGYFVIVMIQMTLISPILERLSSSRLTLALAVSISASVAFTYGNRLVVDADHIREFPYNVLPFFVFLPFYIGGLLAARMPEIFGVPKWLLTTCIAASVVLSILEAFALSDARDLAVSQLKLSSMITSGFVCLAVIRFYDAEKVYSPGIFPWLGRRSYYFYLSHMLVLGPVIKLFGSAHKLADLQVVFVPLTAMTTLAICAFGALVANAVFSKSSRMQRIVGLT